MDQHARERASAAILYREIHALVGHFPYLGWLSHDPHQLHSGIPSKRRGSFDRGRHGDCADLLRDAEGAGPVFA